MPKAEAVLTHFALVLTTDGGNRILLERGQDNVVFRHLDSAPAGILTAEWPCNLPFLDVENFVFEQSGVPYSLTTKNCRHIVYDFLRMVQQTAPEQSLVRDFPGFCKEMEAKFLTVRYDKNRIDIFDISGASTSHVYAGLYKKDKNLSILLRPDADDSLEVVYQGQALAIQWVDQARTAFRIRWPLWGDAEFRPAGGGTKDLIEKGQHRFVRCIPTPPARLTKVALFLNATETISETRPITGGSPVGQLMVLFASAVIDSARRLGATLYTLLLTADTGDRILLQRTEEDNVTFRPLRDPVDGHEVCTWEGSLAWTEVEEIVADESNTPYQPLLASSKHLAYNFMQASCRRGGPGELEDFFAFCGRSEKQYWAKREGRSPSSTRPTFQLCCSD